MAESLKDVVDKGARYLASIKTLVEQGMSPEDAEAAVILERRSPGRSEDLRENSPGSRERALEQLLPEEDGKLRESLAQMGYDLDNLDFSEQERVLDATRLAEYGQDEADFQKQQSDDKNIEGRDAKRLRQQVAQRADKLVKANIETPSGKRVLVEGIAPANAPVPRELREAAMLQELGLAFPPKNQQVPYRTGKDGVRRRQFFKKDKETGNITEFRVGNDGPEGPGFGYGGTSSGVNDAFVRLSNAVNNGEISLDDIVNPPPARVDYSSDIEFEKATRAYSPKTVADLLARLENTEVPRLAKQKEKNEVLGDVIADRKQEREKNRRILREIAIQAKAEGNPLSKAEAESLLYDLNHPEERTERKVKRELADLVRNNSGFNRDMSDEAIGRIEEVQVLGGSKEVDKSGQVQRVVLGNQITRPTAVRMVNPDGKTVGYADPEISQFLDNPEQPNSAASDNQLNAPSPTRGQKFALDNAQMSVNRGSQYGPAMVLQNEPLANFLDVSGLRDQGFTDIRSMEEFDNAVGAYIEARQLEGKEFFKNEGGKQIRVTTPGVDEVLNALHMPSGDRAALANALVQMAQLENSGINEDLKQAYRDRATIQGPVPPNGQPPVYFGVEKLLGDSRAVGEKIKNEKVGGKSVGAALRNIKEDAILKALDERGELYTTTPSGKRVMMPEAADEIKAAREAREGAKIAIQGVAPGEEAERPRFVRGKARDMTPEQREKAYGGKNAEIANEVIRRYEEDKAIRETPAPEVDPVMEGWRQQDAAFEQRKLDDKVKGEGRAIQEIIDLALLGRQYDAPDEFIQVSEGKMQRVPGQKAGTRAQDLPVEFLRNPIIAPNTTAPAQTPASIAPTPGDATGNQSTPVADAGSGGWMGGGNGGRIVNPWSTPEPPESSRRPPQSMIDALNAVSRRKPSNMYMTSPDGPGRGRERREVVRGLERQNLRRRVGIGAAGAGATAGLAALISGEREEREQEAYQ